ncbi:hypothetical protein N0V88_006144 [Collariella sp. IMI 366227]|nr:hypothetical protein N0V88_006144 [Collariella sp. IMI 366227]
MSQPTQYAVMDDYRRTVNLDNPRAGACLNGDTAISPPPDKRNGDGDEHWVWPSYFDITEEWSDLAYTEDRPYQESYSPDTDLPRKFTSLLHLSLPADLPTTRKDQLILMAAYEGNVNCYHRLRRPIMDEDEEPFELIEFADWECIRLAITARRVMVNDLSTIPANPEDYGGDSYCMHNNDDQGSSLPCFPRVIFHPLFPQPKTLMELIWRRPNNPCVRLAVVLASIAAYYDWISDTIDPVPSRRLWQQALKSPNRHYREDIEQRTATGKYPELESLKMSNRYVEWYPALAKDMRPTATRLAGFANNWNLVEPWGWGYYYCQR